MKTQSTLGPAAALVCIVLIAANLRAPVTSVGPVMPEMALQLRLTPVMIGWLAAVPLICFSLFSTFMPRVSAQIGLERSLLYSIVMLALGLCIRSAGGVPALFLGSVFIGIAITTGNVLMPAYIKKKFPGKLGMVTGLYLVSMNLVSALAVGYSISIGKMGDLGWRSSIGIWVLLSVLAFFCWLPAIPRNRNTTGVAGITLTRYMYKSRLAWQISVFMGLQSLVFYVFAAWLPTMLQSWGMSAGRAGWMLSYVQAGQVPMMFIGPLLAGRMRKQTSLVWLTFILLVAGLMIVVVWKTAFIVAAVLLIGIAVGLAFTLATMFFVLRTNNTAEAAALSGMSQSVGYFLAAFGPPLFGWLYGFTASWLVPLLILLLSSLAFLYTGLKAAKDRLVIENTTG
ncbi:MAG: MFS transporter [Chitinophagaceae bacterium]|nr:MFS transporter [Chitinophagaceae bacterium]